MNDFDAIDDPEAWAEQNQDRIVRVLRHSNNPHARACAWALLDHVSEDPEIEDLERELKQLKQQRAEA